MTDTTGTTDTGTTERATLEKLEMLFGRKLGDIDPKHERPDAVYWRPIDDDTEITVYRMGHGNWRVCYGDRGQWGGIAESYCYRDLELVLRAAAEWNGEGDPLDGWHRSPTNGRRREDGDPAREYFRW